jgi:hypothetical protein
VRWLDSEQSPLFLIRQYVQQPVWPLSDVANSLFEIAQKNLASQLFASFIEHDALKVPSPIDLTHS